jgi:hypothetical protein
MDCQPVVRREGKSQVSECQPPYPFVMPKAAEKLNVGTLGQLLPNMNDCHATLRESVQSVPDLIDLVNSAADDLGLDLDQRPTASDEERFHNAPFERTSRVRHAIPLGPIEDAVDDAKFTDEGTWLERTRRYLVKLSGSSEQRINGPDATDGNFGVKLQDPCNTEFGVDTFTELSSKSTLLDKSVESARDELLADFESFTTAQDTLPATDFESIREHEEPQYGSVGGHRQGYQDEQMDRPQFGQQHDSGPGSVRLYNIVADIEHCLRGEPMRIHSLECEANSSTPGSASTPGSVTATQVQQKMTPPIQFSGGKVMTGLLSLLSQKEKIASPTTDSNEDNEPSSSESKLSSELKDPLVTGKMAPYCSSPIQSHQPAMQHGWAFSFFSPVTSSSEEIDSDCSSEAEQNLRSSVLGITRPLKRQASLNRTRTEDEPDFEPRLSRLICQSPRKDNVPEAESVPPVARMARTMT